MTGLSTRIAPIIAGLVTIAIAVAVWFMGSADSDRWLAVAAVIGTGVVWLGVMLASQGNEPKNGVALAETALIRSSVSGIVKRVNEFIDEEVASLSQSLKQIESLADDAVTTLSSSLRSLNHQVGQQSRLLHQLSGITKSQPVEGETDDDRFNFGKVVDDSESIIRYFLQLLDSVEQDRADHSDSLDQVRTQLLGLREFTDHLTGEDAREIRRRMATLRALSERLSQKFSANDWAEKKSGVDQVVGRMDAMRAQLNSMQDVVSMNVAAFAQQSTEDVGKAIRSLQFEDIVAQLIASAQARLDEMHGLVGHLKERVDHLVVANPPNDQNALDVIRGIDKEVQRYSERLKLSRSAVGQTSMDEGSVELF